jgi:hypothetical protein
MHWEARVTPLLKSPHHETNAQPEGGAEPPPRVSVSDLHWKFEYLSCLRAHASSGGRSPLSFDNMMSQQVTKQSGAFFGFSVGWLLGLIVCIACSAEGIVFKPQTDLHVLCFYAAIFALPVGVLGYCFPKTFTWMAKLIALIPLP